MKDGLSSKTDFREEASGATTNPDTVNRETVNAAIANSIDEYFYHEKARIESRFNDLDKSATRIVGKRVRRIVIGACSLVGASALTSVYYFYNYADKMLTDKLSSVVRKSVLDEVTTLNKRLSESILTMESASKRRFHLSAAASYIANSQHERAIIELDKAYPYYPNFSYEFLSEDVTVESAEYFWLLVQALLGLPDSNDERDPLSGNNRWRSLTRASFFRKMSNDSLSLHNHEFNNRIGRLYLKYSINLDDIVDYEKYNMRASRVTSSSLEDAYAKHNQSYINLLIGRIGRRGASYDVADALEAAAQSLSDANGLREGHASLASFEHSREFHWARRLWGQIGRPNINDVLPKLEKHFNEIEDQRLKQSVRAETANKLKTNCGPNPSLKIVENVINGIIESNFIDDFTKRYGDFNRETGIASYAADGNIYTIKLYINDIVINEQNMSIYPNIIRLRYSSSMKYDIERGSDRILSTTAERSDAIDIIKQDGGCRMISTVANLAHTFESPKSNPRRSKSKVP